MAWRPTDQPPPPLPPQVTPDEILDAVLEGVDLFDDSYVAALCSGGYAASFPFPTSDNTATASTAATAAAAAAATPAAPHAGGPLDSGMHPGPDLAVLSGSCRAEAEAVGVDGGSLLPSSAMRDEDEAGGQDSSKINLWSVSYR